MMNLTSKTSKSFLLFKRTLVLLCFVLCSLVVNAGGGWYAKVSADISYYESTGKGKVFMTSNPQANSTYYDGDSDNTITSAVDLPSGGRKLTVSSAKRDDSNGTDATNLTYTFSSVTIIADPYPGSTFGGWFDENGTRLTNEDVLSYNMGSFTLKDYNSRDTGQRPGPEEITKSYKAIFTAKTYHFISPSIRAVYQGESGIETGGGTVALVPNDGNPSRPSDESSAWQTQIIGSLISEQGNGVGDGITYEYAYYAKPNDGYVFLGWHTLNGTTLTKLSGEQNYLPAEGKTATSTNASDPTQGPIMVALFKKSTTYWHTGVSVNIAGYEAERAEKGWVYADKGEMGTVDAVESASKWVTSLHDETAYPEVDQTEYKYTYYAKSSDPNKYAFKGWARTPFGAVDYEGSETNRVLKDYVFTMTDDNTSEINAYPTPTLYAVFESYFFRCPPVAVADNSRGGGFVYVSLASASLDNCTREEISAAEELQQVAATGNSHSYTVYYYAKKADGATFVGWSTTPDGLSLIPNSMGRTEYSVAYESQNKSKSAPHVAPPLYAVFKHDFDIRQQDRMIVYDDEDGNKSINDAKVLIDFQKGDKLTATLSGTDVSNFTLSNRSGSKKGNSITFDATQGLIEMVVAYQGDLTQAVGKRAEITLSATYGSYTEPVKRNVTIIVEEAPMITFLPTDGKGSYTIKMTNGSGINYTMYANTQENINVQITHESMSNLEMNVSDLGADDYRFFGWQMIDGTTTTYISYDDLVNYQFTKSVKVRPEFIHNSAATYSIVNDETNTPYHDFALVMKDAGELAESMGVSQTVVLNDSWKGEVITSGVLPKGNYTIPKGVNLLIPGDTTHTYRTNLTRDAGDFLNQSGLKSAEHIRWIVEEGTNITVQENANILVYSRIVTYGNDDNGRPYQYGHIELKENCKLNFLTGSNLYVYGYITGPLTSEITMNSGSIVKEVFQVKDWRGGSATSSIVLGGIFDSKKVFLIGQFYVQNIEVPLILKKGASEIVEAGISDLTDMDVDFIVSNTGAGLFRMGEGTWVKKYYDPYTDRVCFIGSKDEGATGEIQLDYVSIDAGIATVSSKDYILPIPNNYDIKIQGNLTGILLNDVAFMPGSTLTIEKGSTLKVNKRLFAYDDIYKKVNGNGYYGAGNKVLAPLTYRPGEPGKEFKYKRTEADLVDAKFVIDGELKCDGGEIYTTNATTQTTNHANITSNGGGKVTFGSLSGYDTKVYQIYQDGTSPSYKEVSVSPARLRHGNGTYETNPQTGTYTYVNNKWTQNASTTPDPTIPAEVDYIPRFTVSEVSEASTYVGKSILIEVSAAPNNTNIPIADWANAAKMQWKYELIGTDGNQFTLSGDGGAGTITFAPTSEGRKTVTLRITATYTKNVNTANTAVKYTYSKDVYLTGNASYLAANTLAFEDLSTLYKGQSGVALFTTGNNTQPITITANPASAVTVTGNTAAATIAGNTIGKVTITATQPADLTNDIAGTTLTKIVNVVEAVEWNWGDLYFGTVNTNPVTIHNGATQWTLVEKEDKKNIINLQGSSPNYTASIEDQIAGKYTVTFTYSDNKGVTKDFVTTVYSDPRHLRIDVNNDTVYRAVTLSANNQVSYYDATKAIQFKSTEQNISQWKMTFQGVPDNIYFTPMGVNTWQIEESANGINWTTSMPWKYLETNQPFEMSLLPSTRYLRISYGAGDTNAAYLKEVYITELADVKADIKKIYMPVDGVNNAIKEVVLTYANTGMLSIRTTDPTNFQLKFSDSEATPTDVLSIPATTDENPFGIKGVDVVCKATTEKTAELQVYNGSKLVLQIPINAYLFPQALPIKLATDEPAGGDRYYFVTTHSHNAEWDGTDGVRTLTMNNAVSDAAPYVTFAFEGAPTFISFDYTNVAKGVWNIEVSEDGKNFSTVTPSTNDVMADGKFKRTVSNTSKYIKVIYESAYAEKVDLTDITIVGDASVVVNPTKLELDYDVAQQLTLTTVNLTAINIATSSPYFTITPTTTNAYAQTIALHSGTNPDQLGENKMGDIVFDVKWTGNQMVEYGTIVITNPNYGDAVLATVELTGIKKGITNGDINIYTGVPSEYTLKGTFEGSSRRLVNISAAFSADATKPLFDYVVIYGETTTNDGQSTISTPNKSAGSNAKTPYYIYKKADDGNSYELYKSVENANSSTKAWFENGDDAVTPNGQNNVSMYITGFCPYATTGYTKDDEGVWYFRANAGQSIDVYLQDCYLYSRAKTIDGHTFVDRADGNSFTDHYSRGTGAVLVFACNDKVDTDTMKVTIHTLDNNLLKSNYGCFLQSVAGRAFQASSPVQIRLIDDTYYRAATTILNFTDEWPASQHTKTGDGVRTNGFLSLQKQVNNAPSIDMGNAQTVVNFKGGQVELQNAQIVSTNYASSLAICPRSGKFAGVLLAYGLGTDDVGGTVNFIDGTTTVQEMWVSPTYFESYLCEKDADGNYIKNEKGEYLTTCLRTPAKTYVSGGSHCMMRACQDPTSQGGAPKDKPGSDGKLLGLYKYPKNPEDGKKGGWELDPTTKLAIPSSLAVPTGYAVNSVTPNNNKTKDNTDDDFFNFWFDPSFEPSVQPEVHKKISYWKTCMTRIAAEYAGEGGAAGGETSIEFADDLQTEIVKNFLYCKIDQNILSVIKDPNYAAPVKNPAPAGESYLPIKPSSVGDEEQNFVTNVKSYRVENKVYYITTATADVWTAFTAPFDVAKVYVMETYSEAKLEELAVNNTREDIIKFQAKHNADFAAFFAVTVALGQNKTFEEIYKEYLQWGILQDKKAGLYEESGAYNLRGMYELIPYTPGNWSTSNCYINENNGNWEITNPDKDDGEFGKMETTWQTPDVSDGILMHKGKTYSMLLPYCTGCVETDVDDNPIPRTYWDYWSGKFLIFESTDTPEDGHMIDGSDSFNTILDASVPTGQAIIKGNTTFASIPTEGYDNIYDDIDIYVHEGNLRYSSFFKNYEELDILPTESFMLLNLDIPEGMYIKGVRHSGEIIYGNRDNTTTGNGNMPTISGSSDMLITATSIGINIAVATPQFVRIITASGAILYSGMILDNIDVPIPTNGIYIVAGENTAQKFMWNR